MHNCKISEPNPNRTTVISLLQYFWAKFSANCLPLSLHDTWSKDGKPVESWEFIVFWSGFLQVCKPISLNGRYLLLLHMSILHPLLPPSGLLTSKSHSSWKESTYRQCVPASYLTATLSMSPYVPAISCHYTHERAKLGALLLYAIMISPIRSIHQFDMKELKEPERQMILSMLQTGGRDAL